MSHISYPPANGGGGVVASVTGGNNIAVTGTHINLIINVSGTTNHAVSVFISTWYQKSLYTL